MRDTSQLCCECLQNEARLINENNEMCDRIFRLERLAGAALNVVPYIPEVGLPTHTHGNSGEIVTLEEQDRIGRLANEFDEALRDLL